MTHVAIRFRGEPAAIWKELRPSGPKIVVEVRGHAFTVGKAPLTVGDARQLALRWLASNALRWRIPNLARRFR